MIITKKGERASKGAKEVVGSALQAIERVSGAADTERVLEVVGRVKGRLSPLCLRPSKLQGHKIQSEECHLTPPLYWVHRVKDVVYSEDLANVLSKRFWLVL